MYLFPRDEIEEGDEKAFIAGDRCFSAQETEFPEVTGDRRLTPQCRGIPRRQAVLAR